MKEKKDGIFHEIFIYVKLESIIIVCLLFFFLTVWKNVVNGPLLLLCVLLCGGIAVFNFILFQKLRTLHKNYLELQALNKSYEKEIERLSKETSADFSQKENTNNIFLRKLYEKFLEDIPLLPSLVEQLSTDLLYTNEITEKKVLEIIEALTAIRSESKSLLALMEQQEKKTGDLAEKQLLRLEENTRTLRILSGYQEKRLAQIADDSHRIHEALSEVKNLTTLTKLIREITEQTNLLALNAAVVAARAGAAGRSFAVIAREIRKLSQQIEDTTKQIETQIVSIVKHIEENLAVIVDVARTEEEKKQIALIMNTLSSMNQAFTEVSGYFADLFTESHKVMKQVYQDIIDALGNVQFQDVLRQRIGHVIEGLRTMGDYFSSVTVVLEQGETAKSIENQRKGSLKEWIEELRLKHPVINHSSRTAGSVLSQENKPHIELF